MTTQRKTARRRRNLLRLEALEERTLPTAGAIENFETDLAAYQTALRALPSAVILPIAAHDGLQGLVKQDGYEWLIRNDGTSQVHPGDTVSVWTKLADVADGRAYLGFDAESNGPTHSPQSDLSMLSVVMAANTNQLLIENNTGNTSVTGSFTTVGSVAQTYQANSWYRLEAAWSADGHSVTARLYGTNGTTLLNSVTATTTPPFAFGGGIALRGFGHDKYFDTVVVDTNSDDTVANRANAGGGLDPNWMPGNPPPPVANGPSGDPAPVPWEYTGTPGTGIEVQLAQFNGLQQVAIVGGTVGLAAGNNSLITGTVQVGWGEPLETPLLAQYIFRELPGDQTRLVGASSVKHFFSSAHADSQHLNPGENDTYGAGLNASQTYYTYGSQLNPVTGSLHSPIDRGHLSPDGVTIEDSRTFTSPIQYLLQVNVSDLDPAQNPAGTRWFLMGNEFVSGEEDVSQASRWVEVAPAFNGTTFTFTYPSGAGGQLDFHTIPNLATPAPGPVVTSSTPSGTNNVAPISTARVNFDRPIDASTFTPDKVTSFTGPDGPHVVRSVAPVTGSTSSFLIGFDPLTAAGTYTLLVGPDIRDTHGHQMAQMGVEGQDPYTLTFGIQGLQVVSAVPNNTQAGLAYGLRLTFNEAVDLTTLNAGSVVSFTGPDGDHSVRGVVPVGSGYTQFDVLFSPLTAAGSYTVDVGPFVSDLYGNFLGSDYLATFAVAGPRVTATSPTGTVTQPVDHVRVTFNAPVDPTTFTVSQVTAFARTNGLGTTDLLSALTGVTAVPATNNTQFDVAFAAQGLAGSYTLTLSAAIADTYGNPLSADYTTAPFVINGPRVTGTSPTGTVTTPVDHVRVTFSTAMDPATFTVSQVTAFARTLGTVTTDLLSALTGVTAVAGTGNTQFDVAFAPQGAAGSYTLTLAGTISDPAGNPLAGPYTTAPFVIAGPRVTGSSPTGTVTAPVDHVRVTFSTAMDPATFTVSQVTAFARTLGTVTTDLLPTLTGVAAVAGTGNTQFDVAFATQGAVGNYSLTLAASISDPAGNPLAGPYTAQFAIAGGPHVVSFSPTGDVSGPVDHVRVTFDRAIDPATFTPAQATFLDSGGATVPVTGVAAVAGTGQTQYDVNFASQSTLGSYALTLATTIADLFGNPLTGGTAGQLVTNGGFETGSFSGWTQSGNPGSTTVGGTAHTGRFAANLGPVGSEGFLAQGLATSSGSTYTLDYWLSNGGGTPNQFEAYVNGAVVAGSALSNAGAFGYREYTFTFVATGATTELKFGFQQDPSYYYLDDVSVTQVGGGLTDHFRIV